MSFLGLNLTDWTAIAAFGGVALAAATATAIIIGIRTAIADRKRDDAKRAEDRERDDAKRAEDRQWDSDRRAEDRERDDRLRREAADEWHRRNHAEQRAREDHEARQVTTEITAGGQLSQAQRAGMPQALGRDFNHRIVVSAPAAYPLKGVDVQIVHNSSGSLALRPAGHSGDPASTENGHVYYRFWAEIPEQLFQPSPIVRFVDRHGNLYYSLKGHTSRFPQSTDPSTAAVQIDKWIRTGPRPDGPDA
jgi:hypothetical protein